MTKLEQVTHRQQELREVARRTGHEHLFGELVDPHVKVVSASSAVTPEPANELNQHISNTLNRMNMTLTDLASSAARMASCCGNGDLPGGEGRSYTPCAWVTPLPPVGSCSRGTASIARPARVQPEMSLDLRPFPSPEEQSDQQPEIPLDLRPFPSLEEELGWATARRPSWT